jgi:hypothetical protein
MNSINLKLLELNAKEIREIDIEGWTNYTLKAL